MHQRSALQASRQQRSLRLVKPAAHLSDVFNFRHRLSGTTGAKVSTCQPEIVPHATNFEWR
jgi:hypothetical protein